MDDRLIGQLVQELKDFKAQQLHWQEEHTKTSKEWRNSIDRRFGPIEDFIKNANWSYKFLLGVAGLLGVVLKAWFFAKDHYR